MQRLSASSLLVSLLSLVGAQTAVAEGPPTVTDRQVDQVQQAPVADPNPWRFNLAAYAWLVNVGGSVTTHNRTVDINASFIDLVQKSDSLLGMMAYFEANKGGVGFYTDFVFTKLGFTAAQTTERNPTAGLRITSASASLTYQMFIVEPGAVFELFRRRSADGSMTALDGAVGLRYWNNSVVATFGANFDILQSDNQQSFGIAVARADTVQWVDPVFGLRIRHQLTPHQEVSLRGDIGGFGLGSQFTWQALGSYAYNWQLQSGSRIAAFVGFRALGVNYVSPSGGINAFGINEVLYGPFVGASYRF